MIYFCCFNQLFFITIIRTFPGWYCQWHWFACFLERFGNLIDDKNWYYFWIIFVCCSKIVTIVFLNKRWRSFWHQNLLKCLSTKKQQHTRRRMTLTWHLEAVINNHFDHWTWFPPLQTKKSYPELKKNWKNIV